MIRSCFRWLVRLFLVLALAAAGLLVATPLGRYLSRAAWEEMRILSRRKRIDDIVRDPATTAELGRRLRLVQAARQYAVDSLGLEAGESFTTYSRLDRDTLVLVLSAAYRDRLEAYRWWFPIVGRLPYKGYFDFARAVREREEFRKRGFDTYLRPATAFSTLGWFNDPLLSTTVRADSTWLVNTVLHELSHNTLFVKGHAEFSESFANFIGARGAEAFFRARGSREAAEEVVRDWANEQVLAGFWELTAGALDSAYAKWPSDSSQRVEARDSVYARARRYLVDSLSVRMPGVRREWFEAVQLDNAALLARRVYAQRLDLFDSVWVRNGRDVRRTIEAVRTEVGAAGDPFEALGKLVSRE